MTRRLVVRVSRFDQSASALHPANPAIIQRRLFNKVVGLIPTTGLGYCEAGEIASRLGKQLMVAPMKAAKLAKTRRIVGRRHNASMYK